jgi:hypothetical protein
MRYTVAIISLCRGSAECEHKRLHAGIEKLDLELSISDGLRLSDHLIQPLFGNRAVALVVNVSSVSSARRNKEVPRVTHDDGNRLQRYKWSGNIWEQEKVIERANFVKVPEARRSVSLVREGLPTCETSEVMGRMLGLRKHSS